MNTPEEEMRKAGRAAGAALTVAIVSAAYGALLVIILLAGRTCHADSSATTIGGKLLIAGCMARQ